MTLTISTAASANVPGATISTGTAERAERVVQHATAEHHPEVAEFAQKLMLHAQTEEEFSYPTAILIGEFIKLKFK